MRTVGRRAVALASQQSTMCVLTWLGTGVVLTWTAAWATRRPAAVTVLTAAWLLHAAVLHRYGYTTLAGLGCAVFAVTAWADVLNFGLFSGRVMVAYAALFMALAGTAVVLRQLLPAGLKYVSPIVVVGVAGMLATVSVVHVWHNVQFGVSVTPDIIAAIFQTNPGESAEFVREFVALPSILILLAGAVVLGAAALRQHRTPELAVPATVLVCLTILPIAGLALTRGDVRLFTQVVDTAVQYRRELAALRVLRDRRSSGALVVQATKSGHGETVVVVIGESLNRHHMSLYGYHRATTPKLDALHERGELLRFENAYATHTNTMPSLSMALTGASRTNGVAFFEAPSLIDVARAAGVETYWITNQVLYGPFDHLVSIIGHSADHLVALNRNVGKTAKTQRYDGATVDELRRVMAHRTERNRLIFVHVIGSHTLYCDRFPPEYQQFTSALEVAEFGKKGRGGDKVMRSRTRAVNCYDNSVLYNDTVVADLLEVLRNIAGPGAFLYFADHGEDVLGQNGHHSGRFTFPMVDVPLLAWFSEEYRTRYPERHERLRGRSCALVGTDQMFDTVLGVAGIHSPHKDERNDLSGEGWESHDGHHSILDGKNDFLDSSNLRYHARTNFAALQRRGLSHQVLPHRVNSLGKLQQVLYDGARGLEVDVLYRPETNQFEVGHDEDHMSGNDLATLLARSGSHTKLWLDFKNLAPENAESALAALMGLDERFALKRRLIIESMRAESLRAFRQAGFHTSYYFTGGRVRAHLAQGDEVGLRAEAARVVDAVNVGEVAAVSFDAQFYGFIKKYVEPSLQREVQYHTWATDLDLSHPSLLQQLETHEWFSDARVATVLLTYRSEMTI